MRDVKDFEDLWGKPQFQTPKSDANRAMDFLPQSYMRRKRWEESIENGVKKRRVRNEDD